MVKASSFLLLIIFLSCSGTYPAFAGSQNISSDLTRAASRVLDFPSNICTLQVLHSSIVQNYALLSWQCGEGGGELLLHRQDNAWQSVASDGGAYGSRSLLALGVPENIAVQLIQQLQAQWPEATTDETP